MVCEPLELIVCHDFVKDHCVNSFSWSDCLKNVETLNVNIHGGMKYFFTFSRKASFLILPRMEQQ